MKQKTEGRHILCPVVMEIHLREQNTNYLLQSILFYLQQIQRKK